MRKTMRNVTMVVPVLMTSCQVLEYSKSGPVAPQTTMVKTARASAPDVPVQAVASRARRSRKPIGRSMRAPLRESDDEETTREQMGCQSVRFGQLEAHRLQPVSSGVSLAMRLI